MGYDADHYLLSLQVFQSIKFEKNQATRWTGFIAIPGAKRVGRWVIISQMLHKTEISTYMSPCSCAHFHLLYQLVNNPYMEHLAIIKYIKSQTLNVLSIYLHLARLAGKCSQIE